MFDDIYRDKRVLITGHTGFKGSWLSIWLKLLGAEVVGYALDPPSNPNNFEASSLSDKVIHIHGDVRDYDHLLSEIKQHRPQFVFHMAAQSLVRISYHDPRMTYETNVMGTVNLLEAVRATDSVRVVINVTSDKCYENQEWIWGYREDDPVGGRDPYSSSKGCAELVTAAWQRSFFPDEEYKNHRVGLASVRAGNVIGGGDWGEERILPDCVRALAKDRVILLRNPKAIRPWQHVLEALSGYLLLAARLWEEGPRFNGAWNFGPREEYMWTVEDLVKAVIREWGKGQYEIEKNNHQPHEAHLLKLDCSKAIIKLGWQPRYSVRTVLEKTVDWYKKFYNKATANEMWNFTVGQISEYSSLTRDEIK